MGFILNPKKRLTESYPCPVIFCERLESRQLLTTVLAPIDFGRVLVGATAPTQKITIKNTESQSADVSTAFDIGGQGIFQVESAPTTLAAGASGTITIEMLTATPGVFSGTILDIVVGNTDSTAALSGEVDPAAAKNYSNLGTVGNGTISKSGSIQAEGRDDQEGNVVEQLSDQLYAFNVTSQTTLGLALNGSGGTSTAGGGLIATLLPDQSNGTSNQLTIQERDNPIATLSTSISGTSTESATSTSNVLSPGYYFVYLSESGTAAPEGGVNVDQTTNFSLSMTVKQAVPAAIAVTGNGVVISSGDTTPSTTNGTSFGSVFAGSSESLSFTVTNTGGSALSIGGSRPDVSGDFLATSVLPGSIAAGASATFTVAPSTTTAGAKNGLISISTNVETFTFEVGGTFTSPTSPKPPPASVSKLTATVTARKLAKAASSYAFTVVYSDSAGIDLASLNNREVVLVTGPDGFRKWAKLVSATANANGSVTAVYHLSPPTGSWSKSLNGSYHIYIRGTVLDDGGGTATIFDNDNDPNPLTVVGVFGVHIA